jgi:hypothetical protein
MSAFGGKADIGIGGQNVRSQTGETVPMQTETPF